MGIEYVNIKVRTAREVQTRGGVRPRSEGFE
jgi:hypothetical protein